jgi:hypothetical protein
LQSWQRKEEQKTVNAMHGKRRRKTMMILGGILITALLATEVYCGWYIREYLKERSEERTAARRAAYRHKAYTEMNKRYDLRKSREALWNTITKG